MENNVAVANFNVTFGKNERPMLEYFDEIIYPAFTSELKREYKVIGGTNTDSYHFRDVEILDAGNKDLVLAGKFIRETELEVKNVIEGNKLINKDERYPSAPYSAFYIYLRNHRMVLIKKQKGSPDIKSFGVTARKILDLYIRGVNKQRKKDGNEDLLPYAIVNVVGIPMRADLEKALSEVKKMTKLKLRFYPLNGDLDYTGLCEDISNDLRKAVGSKTGNINLNAPENKEGVIDLIEASEGIMEATIEVEYEGNRKGKISNNNIDEKLTWKLTDDDVSDFEKAVPYMNQLHSIKLTSEDNKKTYKNSLSRLLKYIKRK